MDMYASEAASSFVAPSLHPAPLQAAGVTGSMKDANAKSGITGMTGLDPASGNTTTNFDGVYSMEHSFQDTASQLYFGNRLLSDTYSWRVQREPAAPKAYKAFTTTSADTYKHPDELMKTAR